jgi:hypothetical protein
MADSSSKLIKALFSSSNSGENKTNFDASKINPRILKILGLNEFDIEDEQEYLSLLKEKMLLITMGKSKLPREDEEVIIEEFKRIKSKKFPKKKITADSFKRGTAVEGFINKNVGINLNTKSLGGSIKPQQLALPPAVDKMSGKSDIQEIIDSLASIIDSLSSITEQLTLSNNLLRSNQERDRRATENRRRREREGELEKGFDGVMKAAEKVIAPVKSILDRLIDFFVKMLFGHLIYKLIEWLGNPDNANKVKSIIRFLGDHWPKILALYIAFGTSFGKFTRGLIKLVIGGSKKLLIAIAKLASAKGIGGARGAARFLGGRKGKLLTGALEAGAVVGGTIALSGGIESFSGENENQQSQSRPQTQKLAGGGYVRPRFPAFSGGGLNFKGLMGGAALGSMFGPLGMILGGALGANKPQQSGFVSGEKGVDKVPAMLSDGEFVMSPGAVQKYGVGTLEAMNAAGGGTNKPKIMSGTTYAAGGGMIGSYRETSDALYSIDKFFQHVFENNTTLSDPKTWPSKGKAESTLSPKSTETPTGSLMNDPLGAISRIIGAKRPEKPESTLSPSPRSTSPKSTETPTGSLMNDPLGAISRIIGAKRPEKPESTLSPKSTETPTGSLMNDPLGAISRIIGAKRPEKPESTLSPKSTETPTKNKGFFQELKEKLTGPGVSTYLDAGMIYAKQMMPATNAGPISERDLGKDSEAELLKAIERAKLRTGVEKQKAEQKIRELEAFGASKTSKGREAIAVQKSFLNRLNQGEIRVQYTDYADSKGKLSPDADNAKNILGQFWAKPRSKKDGSGYRIDDNYDFDAFQKEVKDPDTGEMVKKDLDAGELFRDKILGKDVPLREKLQAAFLLNPFTGKGDVDMVLGGTRTTAESMGLAGSKTLLGRMLGISGKPKDKNTQALEEKRPWWDKQGWFGGGSRVAQQQAQLASTKPKNAISSGSKRQQAKLAKTQPQKVTPIKPPSKPKVQVVSAPSKRKNKRGGGTTTTSNTPKFSASTPGMRSKQQTLGMMR